MRWNAVAVKSIQHNRVVDIGRAAQERFSVGDMTDDGLRKAKILLGQNEGGRVHIDNRRLAPRPHQHGAQGAAAPADQQDVARLCLGQQAENRVDIRR